MTFFQILYHHAQQQQFRPLFVGGSVYHTPTLSYTFFCDNVTTQTRKFSHVTQSSCGILFSASRTNGQIITRRMTITRSFRLLSAAICNWIRIYIFIRYCRKLYPPSSAMFRIYVLHIVTVSIAGSFIIRTDCYSRITTDTN